MKHISIVNVGPGLAAAIRNQGTYKDRLFTTVGKIGDAAPGSSIAGLGLPSYIPGSSGVEVISYGTRMAQTAEARNDLWSILRDPASTEEECMQALGNPEEYLVFNGKALAAARLELSEHRCNIVEASSDAEKIKALQDGFNFLRNLISPAPVKAVKVEELVEA